ncbi:MAG TPA: hypothetical protein VEC36_01820 [Patescibacteria group bacterium]|nr:hypothetical protein [Patescibacteria group bacterium]
MSFKTFYIAWIITFFLTATFVFTIKNDVIDNLYGVVQDEGSFENYARLGKAQPVKNAFGIALVILACGLISLSYHAITKKHYGVSKLISIPILIIGILMIFMGLIAAMIPSGVML